MRLVESAVLQFRPHLSVPEVAAASAVIYVLGAGAALLLGMGLKKLFGRYSRMVIGA